MKPSERLIQTIKKRKVRQVPIWHFRLQNTMYWSMFILAVLLGAMAFSVILFALQQADFNMVSHLFHSRLELFLGVLPFFWIILLIFFLVIAIYSIQHSQKGYKFTVIKLGGFSAALSILLGTLFFIGGGAHQLEHAFSVNLTTYEGVNEKKAKIWTLPEDGYLCGDIEKKEEASLHLQDYTGKIWTIQYEQAFVHVAVLLEKGEKIKLVGEMTDEDMFVAKEILPWCGPGMADQRQNR